MKRAGIYCRISLDREGAGLGVERQEQDCRQLCEANGWTVAELYVDNDISASKYSRKKRPAYEAMLSAIRNQDLDVIVAWHPDRLHRRPAELETFISAIEAARVEVQTVRAGLVDLSTPTGRLVARQLGSIAAYESEHKADRMQRRMQQLAEAGAPHKGGLRRLGYTSSFEVIPEEAALVREAVNRILAGEAAGTIAADWNQRGLRTTQGHQWLAGNLRRMMRQPVYAGLRTHHGTLTEGTWEPIIERDRWEQMRALVDGRNRQLGKVPTKHFLTGLAICGKCGTKLNGTRVKRASSKQGEYVEYRCPAERGCGGVTITGSRLETTVETRFLEVMNTPAFEALVARAEAGNVKAHDEAVQLREDLAALEQLTKDHYVEHLIERPAFMAAKRDLDERIAQRRLRLAQSASPLSAVSGTGQTLASLWAERGPAWRRSVLEAAVTEIKVLPTSRDRYVERVQIRWSV